MFAAIKAAVEAALQKYHGDATHDVEEVETYAKDVFEHFETRLKALEEKVGLEAPAAPTPPASVLTPVVETPAEPAVLTPVVETPAEPAVLTPVVETPAEPVLNTAALETEPNTPVSTTSDFPEVHD